MLFDSEVNKSCLGADFRCVVRVTQLSGDIKAKIFIILDFFIAETNHQSATYNHARSPYQGQWHPINVKVMLSMSGSSYQCHIIGVQHGNEEVGVSFGFTIERKVDFSMIGLIWITIKAARMQ